MLSLWLSVVAAAAVHNLVVMLVLVAVVLAV
jgi:hypothetical protein